MASVNVTIFEGTERQAALKLESAAPFGTVKANDLPEMARKQSAAQGIRVRGLTKRTTEGRKQGGTAWSERAAMNKDDVAKLIQESNSAAQTTVKDSKSKGKGKGKGTTEPAQEPAPERVTILDNAATV